ncbi:hypothetical protein OJ997_13140 [Solirubrobacter phytolaccae]|uniref:Uncharacterized protein n=1 Tax=Solirubrobacter phytolaccae TaxID=1404360 RepID=A0A9X3N852_9ACTN|nr:hypothetical protein [Solirubrobacter phytolaccae]MDA0181246.1 hypothetical protein [Solirubrobacter phytolaccae]
MNLRPWTSGGVAAGVIAAFVLCLTGCGTARPESSGRPVAAPASDWVTAGIGRFQWGERWRLRVRLSSEGRGEQCLNLRPREPRERVCPAGGETGVPTEEFESFEDVCAGRAFAYGAVDRGATDVKLVTGRGGALPTRVTLMEAPSQLGGDLRYFVAEARTRRHRARGTTRLRVYYASVRDATGRELKRVELHPGDVVTLVRC